MDRLLILAMVILAIITIPGQGLDAVTEITIIGDGQMTAAYDTQDAKIRAGAAGSGIRYVSESVLQKNNSVLASEFIVTGAGERWNHYTAKMTPDKYGVAHSIESRGFQQFSGTSLIEVGTEEGEKFFASEHAITAIGGFGEVYSGRGTDGKIVDQERIYFGDMTMTDVGTFAINTSIFEDCIELPGAPIEDWLPCWFEVGDPFYYGEEMADLKLECETCSAQ